MPAAGAAERGRSTACPRGNLWRHSLSSQASTPFVQWGGGRELGEVVSKPLSLFQVGLLRS